MFEFGLWQLDGGFLFETSPTRDLLLFVHKLVAERQFRFNVYGHLELQLLLLQNNKHKYALLSQ